MVERAGNVKCMPSGFGKVNITRAFLHILFTFILIIEGKKKEMCQIFEFDSESCREIAYIMK